MNKYQIIAALCCLLPGACKLHPPPRTIDQQVAHIENHLVPAVRIEGEEPVYFSIYDRLSYYRVPGVSVAYIDRGELQWARGYGYCSFDSIRKVNENTLFQAASVSKPVAALYALALVEEGKLDLDRNVNDYLEGWKVEENEYTAGKPVTLRGLLSHTAGLTVHGFRGYAAGEEVPTLVQVLNGENPANSDPVRPDTIPGAINRYSGGGYTVMQKLVEDVTGKAFPDLMKEHVLDVLDMENSTYCQPLPESLYEQASIAHKPDGEKVEGFWHTYPEMAAAGLWTTPADLARYMLEVQKSHLGTSNKILSREMTVRMLSEQTGGHGLGPGLDKVGDTITFGHGGANRGYRCQFYAFTGTGPGVAVMTNSDNGSGLVQEIIRGVADYYNWNTYKPAIRKRIEMEPEEFEKYAGRYEMDGDYPIRLSVRDGRLYVLQEWDSVEYMIIPESRFLFFEMDENTNFEFHQDEDGTVTDLLISGRYNFIKN